MCGFHLAYSFTVCTGLQLGLQTVALFLTKFSPSPSVAKILYAHIRELRCARPYLDSKTASTIATSIIHNKPGMYRMSGSVFDLPGMLPFSVSDSGKYQICQSDILKAMRCKTKCKYSFGLQFSVDCKMFSHLNL